MCSAYNNGIMAASQGVETATTDSGLAITRVVDQQIVTGERPYQADVVR